MVLLFMGVGMELFQRASTPPIWDFPKRYHTVVRPFSQRTWSRNSERFLRLLLFGGGLKNAKESPPGSKGDRPQSQHLTADCIAPLMFHAKGTGPRSHLDAAPFPPLLYLNEALGFASYPHRARAESTP